MHDPRIGQDFGDYIITRKIAEGGMGAVYLAEHPSGMRKVVKFMLAQCLQHPGIRQRFETECLAAKRLKGRSGIVEIDSFGVRNGEMYLVMEFIDGVTLDDHIRQNVRLTPHHTFYIAVQILRALDALHKEGIIHRDLKPSNVFLRHTEDRAWDVKLIDFGIVHDKHATTSQEFRTREGQMIGTPGYMATEQYGRADQVTEATDVFACAIMIWEMLTGELPWGIAENEFAQHNRQLNQTPIWPAQIAVPQANDWPAVLASALVPETPQRPQSAQVFALLLAERLESIPPHVPSGVDLIQKLAPRFLLSAPPDLETIRQSGQIPASIHWPPRASAASPRTPPASWPSLDAIPVSAVSAVATPTPPSAATVSARPYASPPSGNMAPAAMTTLSALNGASVASPPTSSSRSRLVALGVLTALAVAGVTFGVSRMTGKSSSSLDSPGPQPIAPQAPASLPAKAESAPPTSSATGAREQASPPQAPAVNVATPTIAPDAGLPAETPPSITSGAAKKRPTGKRGSLTPLPEKKGATSSGTPPSPTTGPESGSAARASGSAYDPDAIKE